MIRKHFRFFLLSCLLLPFPSLAKIPDVSCVLTDNAGDDAPIDKKAVFDSSANMIYLLCTSDEVKEGQHVKAIWIATETNGIAPANYKVHEKDFEVTKNLDNQKDWTIKYSLSKPYTGWPPGKYRVELFVDDQLQQSINFQVELNMRQGADNNR